MKHQIKNILNLFFLLFIIQTKVFSQVPTPALIGYLHNWNDANAAYIQLDQVDSRYNVIIIAFAVPASITDMTMIFKPINVSQSIFINKIQALKNQGRKVLISVGGANATIDLTTTNNKNAFVTSMTDILNTYGFDGMDIDIEHGSSIMASTGTIANPTNAAVTNLIKAIQSIMTSFDTKNGHKMILTITPETAYVQGGQSSFSGIWGGYLPIIDALRNDLDILQVQLYNSGSMYGIDRKIYTQGNADFIVAMTEAVIRGFNTAGGLFKGIPANKVVIGLPACFYAGGGFIDTTKVKSALDYLRGKGTKPGSYTLYQTNGYPNLGGMMTWSINWDAVSTCGTTYEYAKNFQKIFTPPTSIYKIDESPTLIQVYPNPVQDIIYFKFSEPNIQTHRLKIINSVGEIILTKILNNNDNINIENFQTGLYFLSIDNKYNIKIIKN